MKNLIQKWNNISLIKRIICGLIIGIALGLIFPQVKQASSPVKWEDCIATMKDFCADTYVEVGPGTVL